MNIINNFDVNNIKNPSISIIDYNSIESNEPSFPFENFNFIYPDDDNEDKMGNFSFLKGKIKRSTEMFSFSEKKDTHVIKAFEKIFCQEQIDEEDKDIIHPPNLKDENRINPASTQSSHEREKEEGKISQITVLNNISCLNQEIELEENNEEEKPDGDLKIIEMSEIENDRQRRRFNEILFETRTNQIPGRKPRDKTEISYIKKRHRKNAFDNVVTKIQVNFISFLISFSNDIIKQTLSNDKQKLSNDKALFFKDIDYKIKSNVKSSNLEMFKKLKIKDILQKPTSSKFRSLEEDHNEKIYKKIVNLSKECKEYFNMEIVPIFQKYYNNCKPFNKLIINGKYIYLSKNTKSFYDLVKKNDIIKNELIEYARIVYLGGKEQSENNNFQQRFLINKKY